jgi:CRP-like cAMP-binding protein
MTVTVELFRNDPEGEKVAKGSTIFSAGDPASAMFVVIEGEVEIAIRGKVVEKLGPGGVFGEMALIDRTPRTATARASTDCRLAVIPEKRFLFMVQQTPNFALQIMRVISERLRRMDERL